jgi:Uma2 family endonuclease
MSAIATQEKIYTVEEYFELERNSDIRYEYHYGKLTPMPGESRIANRIASNCEFLLQIALRGKGYDFVRHDVRLPIKKGNIYRYPDLSLTPISDDKDTHAILKAELIIEVSSVNSAKTDREVKLREYSALATMQHYLIISQEEMLVEIYSRKGKKWEYEFYTEPSEKIDLPFFKTKMSLKDVYLNVNFDAEGISDSHVSA